jgi:hypothetical protein
MQIESTMRGCFLTLAFGFVASFQLASAQAPTCATMLSEFEDANKELSVIMSDGIADNSAPRETNRQLKELNQRFIQSMIIDRMLAMKCTLPTQLSSPKYYMLPALECETASTKAMSAAIRLPSAGSFTDDPEYKAKCDRSVWRPSAQKAEN